MVSHHEPQETSPLPFALGDDLMTLDGKRLGAVKDYTHGYIKVDAPRARDYWLSRELILHRVQGCATLSIAHDAVNQWKVRQLDATTEANLGGTDDGLLDEEGRRRLREDMERSMDRKRNPN